MVEIFEKGSCFKYLTTLAVLGSIRKASLGRNKNVVDNSPSNNKPRIQLHGVCRYALNYKKELNSGIHTKNLISEYHLKILVCCCVLMRSWLICLSLFFSPIKFNNLVVNPANISCMFNCQASGRNLRSCVCVSVCMCTHCWQRKQLKTLVIFCCLPNCYLWCVVVQQLFWNQL